MKQMLSPNVNHYNERNLTKEKFMEEEKNERKVSHSSLSFDSGKTDESSRLF